MDPYGVTTEPAWAVIGSALGGRLRDAGARVLLATEEVGPAGWPARVAGAWERAAATPPLSAGVVILTGAAATPAAPALGVAAIARGWQVQGYAFDGGGEPVAVQRDWPGAPIAVIGGDAAQKRTARLRGWTVIPAGAPDDLAALLSWARGEG